MKKRVANNNFMALVLHNFCYQFYLFLVKKIVYFFPSRHLQLPS